MNICNYLKIIKNNLIGNGRVRVSLKATLRKNVVLKCQKGSIDIGRSCLNDNSYISSVGGNITIEDNVFINRNCIIACRESILIKEDVMIGPNVCIYDHDHNFSCDGIERDKFKTNSIIIGKGSWIGAGVIILRGANIGENCIIGAGVTLKGDVPSNTIVKLKKDVINIEYIH